MLSGGAKSRLAAAAPPRPALGTVARWSLSAGRQIGRAPQCWLCGGADGGQHCPPVCTIDQRTAAAERGQSSRDSGAEARGAVGETARGRPQQPGRPLALLFSARRIEPPLLHHFNALRKICQQLSQCVSSMPLNCTRCWRQQGRRRAPHGLDRGSAAAGR